MIFQNRREAGKLLADKLLKYKEEPNILILALPRGGVPVAYEVAQALQASLDLLIVRKLGVPGEEEVAMGAIALGGLCVLNEEILQILHISDGALQIVIDRETKRLTELNQLYRGGKENPNCEGKTIIIIDDGIATGMTMKVAVKFLRQKGAQKIIVAAPVSPADTFNDLLQEADEVISLQIPRDFFGVGSWYEDFSQTTDEEVLQLLQYQGVTLNENNFYKP